MQAFFQNRDEQVDGDGRPDLDAHRVWRGAVKGFDAQRLLDPFEEEFDLPTAAIALGDGQRRHGEVVGQEDQRLASFWIAIADAAERDNGVGQPSRSSPGSGQNTDRWFCPRDRSNDGRSGSLAWRGLTKKAPH
jgi:hypothetical protein